MTLARASWIFCKAYQQFGLSKLVQIGDWGRPMSIEQTSQLIQLILNSVLMTTACSVVLAGLLMHHTALHLQLKQVHQEYAELIAGNGVLQTERMSQLRYQQLWLRYRCRASYNSLLFTSVALSLLLFSTLLLSLRMLLPWQWLISLSLVPFVLGVGALLIGVGMALVEFYQSQRSLQDDLQTTLVMGVMGNATEHRLPKAVGLLPRGRSPAPAWGELPFSATLRRRARKRSSPTKPKTNMG